MFETSALGKLCLRISTLQKYSGESRGRGRLCEISDIRPGGCATEQRGDIDFNVVTFACNPQESPVDMNNHRVGRRRRGDETNARAINKCASGPLILGQNGSLKNGAWFNARRVVMTRESAVKAPDDVSG